MFRFSLILSLLLMVGCDEPAGPVELNDGSGRKSWPVTCEMCGHGWQVIPNNPEEVVPPTIEWCFDDGGYCQNGVDLLIEATDSHSDKSPEAKAFFSHCKICVGCKCAAFTPDRWAAFLATEGGK